MNQADQALIDDLNYLSRTGHEIDLLNVHKGIPVLYKTTLKKYADDRATVSFGDQFAAICLLLERRTTLLSDRLVAPVNATAFSVDLPTGTATLNRFRYAARTGDRMILRAEPAEEIPVVVETGQGRVAGTVVDLSMSGVGLIVPPDKAAAVRIHGVVRLKFTLDSTPLDLSGPVRYLKPQADACRVGVNLVQTPEARLIFEYVHRRQDEILRELETLYRSTVESKTAC